MHLVGANPNARVATTDELPSKTNYFIGNDRKKWRTNVPTYARVRYHDVYPGIDLVYYGNQSGQVEYDFVVAPGADPKAISLAVAADSSRQGDVKSPLQIAANGDLIINGSGVRFHKPVVFQPSARPEPLLPSPDPNPKSEIQNRKFLDGRYIFTADNQIRFELGPYDHTKPLVIDPAIVYSTLLGGATFQSSATAIAVFADPATGHVYAYVAGETCAPDFPTVNAEQSTYASGCSITTNGDAFVTKFDPAASGGASVVYSTYLGGSGPDSASGIAVDSAGNAYVVGNTQSTSFPTMNAYQTATHAPVGPYGYTAGNAFLAKLSADGSTLLYSTYFGGSGVYGDGASAIAVDTAGRAYIVGGTSSTDLPTVNPYQAGPAGDFLAIFDTSQSPAAQLLYSTYLSAAFNAVAVDATNSVHLAGSAYSTFPAVNGVQTAPKTGPSAALYAKLNPAASGSAQLVYSTYLGGGLPGDTVHGIALDPAGNVYLSGSTFGGVFPVTAGAYQTALLTPVGYPSAFVAKINPSLSGGASLIYSTLLSGPGADGSGSASGIAVETNGNAFVTGSMGPGLPLVNPVMGPFNGVFQSLDAGHSWIALTQGLGTAFPITALAIDASTSPRTLYVGTGMGGNGAIYTSADGGLNWTQVFQVPSSSGSSCTFDEGYTSTPCVMALAVDPSTPPNVYAGTSQGVYKSADRGATWTQFNTGLSGVAAEGVRALLFDSGTFWAGAGDGLYKLSSGATSWTATTLNADVEYIAADPTTTPHTLYTSSQWGSGNSYKSTDGGATWNNIWITAGAGAAPIAVDTSTSPSTLYASSPYSNANFSLPMFKSVDGGNTWEPLANPGFSDEVDSIAVDSTQNPSIIYARAEFAAPANLVKSVDGGNSWTAVWSQGGGGQPGRIAVDLTTGTPTSPATLYYTTWYPSPSLNAFVAELNPSGSALLFSTYLGGIGGLVHDTFGNAIAIDASDNIYLAGSTFDMPTVNAYQASPPLVGCLTCSRAAFFTELGSQMLPESSPGAVTTQVAVQTGTLAITFPNITGSTSSTAPTLTVSPLSSTATANFSLSNNLGAYDISTTVSYSGSVTVCFQALTVNDVSTFNNLQIIHVVNGTNQNVTTSWDFPTRSVCGTATSLSPFVLVMPASTTSTLVSSANPAVLGQPTTLTATVTASSGSPTGSVTFSDGSTTLATVAMASGQASFTTSKLAVGSHSLTATYCGGPDFTGSASPPLKLQVQYEPAGTSCLGAAGHQILQPINADGTSVWKQGRTIPAQFRVCDVNGTSIGAAGVVNSFLLTQIISGTVTSVDETVSSTATDTAFRWDATNQQWIFNISTKSLAANNTFVYTVTLNDGTTIGFQYGLK